MVRSMFAGVSGLKSHQQKMDVIGNNIANVNTWGYKAYSFNFQDSIYSTSIRSSGGNTAAGAYGGRNPSQVGYGSSMASISFQYTTGAPSPTDNDLDCMIDGTGLFMVGSMNRTVTDVKASGLMLTRVGMFTVDDNGYLVDSNKNYVYGYALKEGTGIPEVPWDYASYSYSNATPTLVTPTVDGKVDITILGVKATVNNNLSLEDKIDAWRREVAKTPAFDNWNLEILKVNENNNTVSVQITAKEAMKGVAGNTAAKPFTPAAGDPQPVQETEGVDYVAAIEAEFEETLSPIRIPIDDQTGSMYNLQSYSISEDGVIVGVDQKNRPITMGQLALITVDNPNGLEKTSGYYFNIGDNAGDIEIVKPNTGPGGFIRSKFLEMPNVDLANEFSNMITCQRGFQANSKIITVTDEMLQELVNMKR